MTHHSRLSAVVIDVPPAAHGRELELWQAATGRLLTQFDRHREYHGGALPGGERWLLVQRLGEGPGRVHIDIHTDDLAAEWPGWEDSARSGSSKCTAGGCCTIPRACRLRRARSGRHAL